MANIYINGFGDVFQKPKEEVVSLDLKDGARKTMQVQLAENRRMLKLNRQKRESEIAQKVKRALLI